MCKRERKTRWRWRACARYCTCMTRCYLSVWAGAISRRAHTLQNWKPIRRNITLTKSIAKRLAKAIIIYTLYILSIFPEQSTGATAQRTEQGTRKKNVSLQTHQLMDLYLILDFSKCAGNISTLLLQWNIKFFRFYRRLQFPIPNNNRCEIYRCALVISRTTGNKRWNGKINTYFIFARFLFSFSVVVYFFCCWFGSSGNQA